MDDIGTCLNGLGVVHHSHELLETKISQKLELNNDLLSVRKELEIVNKRKAKKEAELDQIYKSDQGGRNKRKIQALLSEQEKLLNKLVELDTEEAEILDKLEQVGGANTTDRNVLQSEELKKTDYVQDTVEGSNGISSKDNTELQVKLGNVTSFGTTLESTQEYCSAETIQDYMNKIKSCPQSSSSASARKNGESSSKWRRLEISDDESDYNPTEEIEDDDLENDEDNVDYVTDSDDDIATSKRFKKVIDDGDKEMYIERLKRWEKKREPEEKEMDGKFEQLKTGLKVPSYLWSKLYNYQKVGVQWMYELHQQKVGGVLGDEMGLGKTIQVIAFLASLSYTKSKQHQGATLIVAPTTLLQNWVHEVHTWWPPFRVGMLHASGSYTGSRNSLIRSINYHNGILVLSYQSLITYKELLSELNWGYCILDEGHKIRNPDAQVTLAAKQITTPHRIILSGSPLQNNLKELWSLFDFVYPSKLGTLPTFIQQFSAPITQGGFANASEVQVATAFKCATVLKDTINPYLLRRMKQDVKEHINLPEKNEQVLFCKLSDEQRALYRGYIESPEIKSILDGRMRVFVGLIALRKICNHPDIFFYNSQEDDEGYGYFERSGKMIVVHSLLKIWKKQNHRVLLFTQSRQMLKILESYAKTMEYTYLKMDGTTSVGNRQPMINKFNESSNIFLFLLTTKVGGLGVNLVGANRVVIFDPDWNPSTDTQARERAWRIGQKNQVTIYRLMTSGTIEEKIYHRQIYKQFLINRVLKDPKQRRFFKSRDLFELFTLNETNDDKTETSAIFAGTGTDVKVKPKSSHSAEKRRKMIHDYDDASPIAVKRRESEKFQRTDATKELFYESPEEGEVEDTPTHKEKKRKRSHSDDDSEKRREKKKKRHSREERGAKFEGERVRMLVKKRRYKAPQNPDKPEEAEDNKQNGDEQNDRKPDNQDNYVLAKLFRKSGVHSAVQHDAIMENGTADYAIIESEAEYAAKEAMKALRASRAQCQTAETGIPNWTGQHGQKRKIAMNIGNKPLASSDLLARMKNRNKIISSVDRSNSREGENLFFDDSQSNPNSKARTEDIDLLTDIRNFVAFQTATNGEATTTELVKKFHSSLPSQRSPLFKAFLKQICDFRRGDDGKGIWFLKTEFRS